MAKPRILDVGQCSYDHGSISRHLSAAYGAEVARAQSAAEALKAAKGGGFDLILINRQLDRDGSPGVDVIRALKADPDLADVPVMLVSNFPEAQAEAQALGALPGFGKADLRAGHVATLDAALSPP
ncbi:response regulator [Tundrisphaera sp. TA3]|uniref:response regulator n=1 Tax=Tundrisphaera sp. TA3 TaxID=3435775 RepID=UPI003EC10D8E